MDIDTLIKIVKNEPISKEAEEEVEKEAKYEFMKEVEE